MKTKEPIAWHKAKHGMFLESPFTREFYDELRLMVPSEDRIWNQERRQWWISDLYLDEVDNLLIEHFERPGTGREF